MNEKNGMTQEREVRILEAAIQKYGTQRQILKAVEEMGELIATLTKYLNADDLDECHVEKVYEEMADVSIMLNQLCLIFGEPVEQEIYKLECLERKVVN